MTVQAPIGRYERHRCACRGGRVQVYNPAEYLAALEVLRVAWQRAAEPVLDDGPYEVALVALMLRPASHLRGGGLGLTAAGRRAPFPTGSRLPDLDNVVKLALDALGPGTPKHPGPGAIPDDRYVVSISASKGWTTLGPRTKLLFRTRRENPDG
jgi:Holliday junction resolvase RusA-like endonuclease